MPFLVLIFTYKTLFRVFSAFLDTSDIADISGVHTGPVHHDAMQLRHAIRQCSGTGLQNVG